MLILVFALSRCMNSGADIPADIRGPEYAGAASCKKCHAGISDSYVHSAHAQTSKPALTTDIEKTFAPDSNTFTYMGPLMAKVEKRDSGYYQVAYMNGKEIRAAHFDVVFGSGEKAFTYGYWQGKVVKELPLSYFKSINNWASSPGFPISRVYFDRPVTSRCFECHGSFIEKKDVQTSSLAIGEELERASIIYGVDCERCHGPAREHVVFHQSHPEEKKAQFITLYKNLTRKQKIDACAVCHSGNDVQSQKSTFAYKPGEDLSAYYSRDFSSFGGADPDVHGNQSTMLAGSKCFIQSKDMTCGSCHNTHESLKGNLNIYSQRCMNCHQTQKHSPETIKKGINKANCIDCHMPQQASKLITFKTAGNPKENPYVLRSHHIGIFPN
ncbi:MAG: hypothetical protein EOO88_03165 [Pedobacter sp.]|nr:MAG: hypothetical protein EOO88_03165 [Pedobacter sp.]